MILGPTSTELVSIILVGYLVPALHTEMYLMLEWRVESVSILTTSLSSGLIITTAWAIRNLVSYVKMMSATRMAISGPAVRDDLVKEGV